MEELKNNHDSNYVKDSELRLADIGNSLIVTFYPLIELVRNHREKVRVQRQATIDETVYGLSSPISPIKDKPGNERTKRFYGEMKDFSTILEKRVGEDKCKNFLNNIKSIKVYGVLFQPDCPFGLPEKISERYIPKYNELFVLVGKKFDYSSLLDGFMQVACRNSLGSGEMGFNYIYNGVEYGTALTSGYMSLLNLRYFYEKGYKSPDIYNYFVFNRTERNDNYSQDQTVHVSIEQCVAALIEEIVGAERMQEYFFGAKSRDFIETVLPEFEFVDSQEKVRYLLAKLDNFPKFRPEVYGEIIFTVCKWFSAKHLKQRGMIPPEDLFSFKSKLPVAYFNGEKEVPIHGDGILRKAMNASRKEFEEARANSVGFTRAKI